MAPSVRAARVTDADAIRELTSQLGYDVESSFVTDRLARILSRSDQQFLVAELEGQPVAWIHLVIADYVETGPFAMIGGLVVEVNHRRQGIGRLLMQHGEDWARTQGCPIVRLWSSSSRIAAHRFYEQLGYANIKTQYSFVKSLDGNAAEQIRMFVPRVREPDGR